MQKKSKLLDISPSSQYLNMEKPNNKEIKIASSRPKHFDMEPPKLKKLQLLHYS